MDNNNPNSKKFINIDPNTISEDIDVVLQEDPIKEEPKLNKKVHTGFFDKKPSQKKDIATKENENQKNNTQSVQSDFNFQSQKLNNNSPINTISNSVNSFKNGHQSNEDLSNKLQKLKNKSNQLPTNSKNDRFTNNSMSSVTKDKSSEAKEKIKAIKDKAENKIAGKAIQAATGGAISAKNAEKLAMKAKVLLNRKKKIRAYIAIGVSIGLLLIIVVTSILMNNDDESLTSQRTNNYILDSSTDEELIDYMGFIAVCPSVQEAKAKAEEYGIELEEDKVTFAVMRKLAAVDEVEVSQTCLNAMDYYEAFKKEYVENKKACYKNRNENGEQLPNYWRHYASSAYEAFLNNDKSKAYFLEPTGGKDKYDCQIKLPTELIFETMSYNLTDQDLFNKDYLDRYDDYAVDLRKLSNALSEYMQETCYKWMYKDRITGEIHSEPCSNCDKVKVPHDGFYFQISFNKFVCYLKYGDSCAHPNYLGKPRQKFPDLQYLQHLCGSPAHDKLEILEHPNEEIFEEENEIYNEPALEPAPNQPLQSGDGNEVVSFATQFLHNPYVYGGTSLTNGIDCSGFTMKVYEQFGVSLPHSSTSQRSVGQAVSSLSEARPGDLLCFDGHVGIYMGNNQMIHASGKKTGIKISNNVNTRKILAIRRVVE